MSTLSINLATLTPAERGADALLRATFTATLEQTRVLLLDLLVEIDGPRVRQNGTLVDEARRREREDAVSRGPNRKKGPVVRGLSRSG